MIIKDEQKKSQVFFKSPQKGQIASQKCFLAFIKQIMAGFIFPLNYVQK